MVNKVNASQKTNLLDASITVSRSEVKEKSGSHIVMTLNL